MGRIPNPLAHTRSPPLQIHEPPPSARPRLQLLQSRIWLLARREKRNQPRGKRITPMPTPNQRMDSRRWKNTVTRERHRLERHPEQAVCWLCGNTIDMQLPTSHPMSFTLDHIVPLARGGNLHGEVRPAHRSCNSARGNGRTKANTQTLAKW